MDTLFTKRNGEVYELLGELLGECSACDLHMALSLVSKWQNFGLSFPTNKVRLEPKEQCQRRQRRRQQTQLAFGTYEPTKAYTTLSSEEGGNANDVKSPWINIPEDLLLKILDSLACEDKQVLGCVCLPWKRTVGQNTTEVSFAWAGRREMYDSEHSSLVDQVVKGASMIYSAVRCVSFRRCELLSGDAMARFAQKSCSQLQDLDLSGCTAMTDVGVVAVAESCPLLERLQLASCQCLTDASFVALGSSCPHLQLLSACGCEQLTDFGLIHVSQGARGLISVNLGWCEEITDRAIEALATNCPKLLSLDLCGCLQVGDVGIAALARCCPDLKSLGLHCCRKLTDASQLSLAAHIHCLTSLNISGCRALTPPAVQAVVDSNPCLHTCGGLNRNVIVAGCLNLLSVTCSCPPSPCR